MTLDQEEIMDEDTQHDRYLTFSLGQVVFGIEIKFVTEIIGIQPITPLPEVPDYVRGIVNLRGKIIPVIDMRLKFGLEHVEYNDRICIIVIETSGKPVGLIVDKVAEVVMIGQENIEPPPACRTDAQKMYVDKIGKVGNDVKLLLSCDKLFMADEAEAS